MQMVERFSKIKNELKSSKRVSVGKVSELLKISKHEADDLIQAYLKKYESQCTGVFVVTSIQAGRISTKVESSEALLSDPCRTVLSSYLIALIPADSQEERFQYSDFAFTRYSEPAVREPLGDSPCHQPNNLLKTSAEVNQLGLKRAVGPADQSEEEVLKKQTTKIKPEPNPQTGNSENRPAERTVSNQQKKPSLFNFFNKKTL